MAQGGEGRCLEEVDEDSRGYGGSLLDFMLKLSLETTDDLAEGAVSGRRSAV